MTQPISFAYRPDVDGLRAVAVIAVIAFHAAPDWATGGFVGVDIFFVISGYLISGIILSDLTRSRFSFANFYSRRIRRIFPALSVVLAAVLAYGWLVLLSDEYSELGKHVAAGAGFVSNLVLRKEAGYFDVAAELKPLLHLWSLGIEEQFYLVWPLCMFVMWRYRRGAFMAIAVLAVGSFAANVALIGSRPESVYYLPLTRFWELLLGAALVCLQSLRDSAQPHSGSSDSPPAGVRTRELRDLQAGVGVLLIAVSIVVLNRQRLFPGWWALLPTSGTALIIAAGRDAWINRVLLSHRTVVFIGLISYPLYLWHWPLLSFARIIEAGHPAPAIVAGAVLLAFALAVLTYRFVELPIRSNGQRVHAVASLVVLVGMLGTVGWLAYSQTFPPRSAAYGLDELVAASHEMAYPGFHLRKLPASSGELMEEGSTPTTVLFIGDSNIEQYYPRIDKLVTDGGDRANSVVFATSGGCAPIPNVGEDHHPGCGVLLARGLAYAGRPEVTTVVIGAAWHAYFLAGDARYAYYFRQAGSRLPLGPESTGSKLAFAQLESTVKALVARGKQVYIVLQIPLGEGKAPQSMIRRSFLGVSPTLEIRPMDRAVELARREPLNSRLIAIASAAGARTLDPLESLCSARVCPVVTSRGEPIYRDAAHLRPAFVSDHVRFLDNIVLSRESEAQRR